MINHFRSEMKRPLVGLAHSLGASQLYVPLSRVSSVDYLRIVERVSCSKDTFIGLLGALDAHQLF